MAKSSILMHKKFLMLVRTLDMPQPHVLGHLEYLWQSSYVTGPVFRSKDEIEVCAGWIGQKGTFADALCDPSHTFIDTLPDGTFQIHNFVKHAPEFAVKRLRREKERSTKVIKRRSKKTYSGVICPDLSENGGKVPPAEPNPTEPNPTEGIKADPPDPPLLTSTHRRSAQQAKPKTKISKALDIDVENAVSRLLQFEHERNRGPSVALMWRMRVRAMARLPDGLFAVHKICDECETRRNPRAAESKGYSRETIRDEPAWLNQQTSKWLDDHDRKAQ